jgi:hypothetical protein
VSARPVVAVLLRMPLVLEGLHDELSRVADVRALVVREGETSGLLASIQPDAVLVDHEESAEAALTFARATDAPAIYVRLPERQLEVARAGEWRLEGAEPSPESIRNLLAGELFGKAHA